MTPLLAALALIPQAPTDADALIAKALAKGKAAHSARGRVHWTISAEGQSAGLDTEFAFQDSSLVYVRQFNDHGQWFLVSDGVKFCYQPPENLRIFAHAGDRLLEPVNQRGIVLGYRDIYEAGATGLRDRNVFLETAIARPADLQLRRDQWVNAKIVGEQAIDGKKTLRIEGGLRLARTAPARDHFALWLTEDGAILRYQEIAVVPRENPANGKLVPITVTSVWQGEVEFDVALDKSIFTLP